MPMNNDLIRKLRTQGRRLGRTEAKVGPLYLEDTYVPTYEGGTTPGVTTYTTQVGFWKRVGHIVFFNGRVTWTAATGTGTASISLPFTSEPTANNRYSLAVYPLNVTFANGSIVGLIAPNSAIFQMNSPATNAGGTAVAVEAAGDLIFAGYFSVA